MSDTIVIDGEVELLNVIDGEVELLNVIDGDPDVFIGGGGSQPTGTKSILLTEAGTKTEDVTDYAYAEINAVTSATASGAVASFSDGAEDVPMDSCLVNIEPVQSGSGDPSPSNVRPISGWSEVNVSVSPLPSADGTVTLSLVQSGTGDPSPTNIRPITAPLSFTRDDNSTLTVYGGTLNTSTGVLTVDRGYIVVDGDTKKVSSVAKSGATNNYYSVVSMTGASQSNASLVANMFKNDGTSLANLGNIYQIANGNIVFVQTDQTLTTVALVNAWLAQNPLQLVYLLATPQTYNLSSTELARALAALDIAIYPVSLGQTVYGGTLDVVSGVLTVDRAKATKPSCGNVLSQTNPAVILYVSSVGAGVNTTANSKLIANVAPTVAANTQYLNSMLAVALNSSKQLRLSVPGLTTGEEYANWIDTNNLEVVYPLDTPTTVQLTPTEVTTLLGSNNVWADSGDISVGYKADVYLSEGGVTPTGTKSITITTNGTTTEDVTNYASASITTNVPNSYSASDEGKVVSNGALVAQTSDTVTTNDTYDTTLINSLTVNVSGGGGLDINDIAMGTVPSGALVLDTATSIAKFAFRSNTNITSVSAPNVTSVGEQAFNGCTNITSVYLPNVTTTGNSVFESTGLIEFSLPKATSIANYVIRSCASLKRLFLPKLGEYSGIGGYGLQNCRSLEVIDLGFANVNLPSMPANTPLHTLILRRTTVATLGTNGLNNSTAFVNGGTGGDIYIPKSLYDQLGTGTNDYKSATNWSAYDGYGTITWHAIEGSIYEL